MTLAGALALFLILALFVAFMALLIYGEFAAREPAVEAVPEAGGLAAAEALDAAPVANAPVPPQRSAAAVGGRARRRQAPALAKAG